MMPTIDMQIHNLFPIPVARFEYLNKITKKQLSVVNNIEYTQNLLNTMSVNKHVLDITEFEDLKTFSNHCVLEYFKKVMGVPSTIKPYITISWINITNKAGGHHKHTHPNSILSGVFYIQTTNEDRLHFDRSEINNQISLAVPTQYTELNSQSWWVPATQNVLYIFPSSLAHYVEAINTDSTRISLSFNTFVTGTIGNDLDATTLTLS